MEIVILLYNIVITAVLALSMACAYYLFKRRRSRTFLAVGVMFLLYLMDNTVVLCTEIIPSFSESYDTMFISTPSFKTVYFAGLLACVLYIYLSVMFELRVQRGHRVALNAVDDVALRDALHLVEDLMHNLDNLVVENAHVALETVNFTASVVQAA